MILKIDVMQVEHMVKAAALVGIEIKTHFSQDTDIAFIEMSCSDTLAFYLGRAFEMEIMQEKTTETIQKVLSE